MRLRLKALCAAAIFAWIPTASAVPVPALMPWLTISEGGGINFDGESCCIDYSASTDLLVAASIGQMTLFQPGFLSPLSFVGTWLLQASINEQFQVTDRGSVSLFGDVGNGYQLLIGGSVTGIGFAENVTEFDSPSLFYGIRFMQIAFEIHTASDLVASIFGRTGAFITGHEIGDWGEFLPGERSDSPFAQDFSCGTNAFRCRQFEGSYGLNPLVRVAEPATLALFGLGLAGLAFARRRKLVQQEPHEGRAE